MKRRSKKKKNNKIFIIILALFFVIILLIFGYFLYNDYLNKNRMIVKLNKDLSVEINSEKYLLSFVDEVINGEIVTEDKILDTSKLGEYDVKLSIKNNFDEVEEYTFNYIVDDSIKPTIEAKENITIYVGNKIDLIKDVTVIDNSLEEIKATVIGEYDTNKVGEYKLKYVAKDSSENLAEYDFILNVISDPNNRTFTTSKGYSGKVVNGITYIDGVLIANKSYGLPSNYGSGLTNETVSAFNKMKVDATGLGLNLYISSGYRSYYDQKYIYNNYVKTDGQKNADTYSARAGHSEHQTGLAFDLNSIDISFASTDEGKWVVDNCYKYGFIIRYPEGKDNITGYIYEPWHLRYVGVDLATKLYNQGDWITLEEYYGIDSKYS